ncbi:histidine phosphatase family protein [Mucilaginibacter sp. PAMB04168]|uniref:SixA phosphatase family protein n=1 Tax=Mucilaginibacter sp. PAMB04168 TaxID=3138567 RepID=UPI0031F62BC8
MKHLLLIRHAKAEPDSPHGDFERALSAKGIKQATELAGKLNQYNIIPNAIVCSPAMRTITTAQILAKELHLSEPHTDPAIYEASEHTLLKVINLFPDEHDFMALIGHNPGISYLLLGLSGEIRDVPPCTAILVTFEVDSWQSVSPGSGSIAYYTSPKEAN